MQLVSSYRQSQSSHAFPSEESDLIAPSRLYFHQLLQRYDTELAAFADHEVYIQVKEHLEGK